MESETDVIESILRYTKTLKILVIVVIAMIMLLSVQMLVSYVLITNIQVECNKNPRIVVIKPEDNGSTESDYMTDSETGYSSTSVSISEYI